MHPRLQRFKRLFLIPLVLALAACDSGDHGKGGKGGKGGGHNPMAGMPPPEVTVVTVAPQALPMVSEYVGQTAGSREVEVRARVTGILLKKNFAEGGPVKKGQSLFTIDPIPFQAAAARAEADLAAVQARYDQAKRNAERFRPLYADKAVSQKELDDAVSAEAIGAADLKAAQARLTEARLNLEYTRVEAPVSGIASRAVPSEGTLVSGPGVLLTTVVQVNPIWVNFGIPDNERARLRKEVEAGRLSIPENLEVELRLPDGGMYKHKGKVNFSDVRIAPGTGTREARAELPNPEGALQPGQFVRVLLRGATRPNAVAVPQRAVLEGPQGKFVYLVNEKSIAEARPVQAGEWSGEDWIITDGLKAGERVIVDGVMKLGPGAPVRIAEKKPAAEKPEAKKK